MKLKNIYNEKFLDYSYINPCILKYINKNQKVLDIGCNCGDLGEIIKNKGNFVVGVDISKNAINIAKRRLNKVICLNVEEENLPFDQGYFDIIVLGDILEHLYDPKSLLIKLKEFLKKEGYFIISIPNVANYRIRLNLLFGKFEYTQTGILDESHIRFFTLDTLNKLVFDTGLNVKIVDVVPVTVKKFKKLGYFITKFWKTFLANQFVVVVDKK